MKQGWLVVVLLLSLGVNLGLVGTAVARRHALEQRWSEGATSSRRVEPPADRFDRRPGGVVDRPENRPGNPPENRPEKGMTELPEEILSARLADRLGLDGERRERFVAAHRRMAESVAESRREIRRIREAMRHELAEREPDRGRVDGLLSELARAEAGLNHAFADGILEARTGLDPEESRKLLWLIAELGLVRQLGDPRAGGVGAGLRPFGRRPGLERRSPPPEPASPARP